MKKHLQLFIDDIKNNKFYEAHEDLEHYWHTIRKTDHPLKNLCKGFINGATAFELIRRGNDKGARTLWKTYEKYLPIMQEGIENYELFKEADDLLQELKKKHHVKMVQNTKGTNMSVTLDTRTFFFNAETDFLAYYRNHEIKIDDSKKLIDVLEEVQKRDEIFEYPKDDTQLVINGVSVKGSLDIKKAVELFGSTWTIDPISTYRAIKDLVIDDSDFIQKHEILAPFIEDDKDFEYYKSLKPIYYASSGLDYSQYYMGDSMFIYAHYLIKRYPAKKAEILKAIDKPEGIWMFEKECSMYPLSKNMDEIEALKEEFPVVGIKGYNDEQMEYYNKAEDLIATHFGVEKDEDCALETIVDNITIEKVVEQLKYPFDNFSVAFYAGSFECESVVEVQKAAEELLTALGAKVVKFANSDVADGFDVVAYNKTIGYKKAGNIVLDAYDSGAEILVVDNRESHFMLDQKVKECEKAVGREIHIPVLNISQMVALAIGLTNKEKLGLDFHKIKPEFI